MSKEYLEFERPVLNLGINYAKNGDIQCAAINLYYNGINHIIYDTTDKEQVEALSKIMQAENKKQQDLQELEGYRKLMGSPMLKLVSEMETLSKCRKTLDSINDIVAKYFNCIIDAEEAFGTINELLKDIDWSDKYETNKTN